MRHPFCLCATKYCLCCLNCGVAATCYTIAVMCITINGFAGVTNFGIDHWALYLASLVNLGLHLLAGVALFLGTVWDKVGLKMAYCWMTFAGIFTVIIALILYLVFHNHSYVIWDDVSRTAGVVMVVINVIWLLIWDIYTPMIVLGNLYEEELYCT